MKNNEKQDLRSEFESYLMEGEEPIKSFNIGSTKILLTNERLICLKKFPKSFIPIFYDDITNIEHHTYISWNKFINGIISLFIAVYFYYNGNLMEIIFKFLNENVPEVYSLIANINPGEFMKFLILILILTGVYQLIQFFLSFTGRLRISIKGSHPIRIRTGLTPEVSDLIKRIETIKKYRIKEVVEETKSEISDIELKVGGTYIIREYRPEKSIKMFFNEVKSGDVQGLYISRVNPTAISREYNLTNVSYYWLTDSITDSMSVSPEPERIFALITDFLENTDNNKKTVIFFDGIEYLITHSNFKQVLHLIQGLVDKIEVNDSKLIIPLNPDALSEKEIALIEREVNAII